MVEILGNILTSDADRRTTRLENSYIAGGNINVNKVIALRLDGTVEHADKDNISHQCNILGVSRQSASIGQSVIVVLSGILSGISLGAIADDFFLGNNGSMASTAPISGIYKRIGEQQSASSFLVKLGETVIR